MNRIEVDFNNRGASGTVRGSLRRARNVKVNDIVTLTDTEEGMEFEARVVEVDAVTGRVLYAPLWERAGFAEAMHKETQNALILPKASPATEGAAPIRVKATLPTSFGPFPGSFVLPTTA